MENLKIIAVEKRSTTLLKAISWRFFGSVTTFGVTFFMTGSINIATTVSAIELLSKIFLFYLHERVWIKISNVISYL